MGMLIVVIVFWKKENGARDLFVTSVATRIIAAAKNRFHDVAQDANTKNRLLHIPYFIIANYQ